MKTFFWALFLVSSLAVTQSASIGQNDLPTERSVIDLIIKAVLESFKPKLANITIADVDENVVSPNFNATIQIQNIKINNADKFVINCLKSNIVLCKLSNLTMTWNNISASAFYNINITVRFSENNAPLNIFAKGDARGILNNVYFTIGANLELKNNAIQIKKRGLFGFDVRVQSANVTLSSLMGSEELGAIVGRFLSRNIPGTIEDLKNPLFNSFQDNIIDFLNNVLKNNGTKYMDEEKINEPIELEEFKGFPLFLDNELDLSEESLEDEDEY